MTAERLFAERGLAGVSLSQIGIAAGQKNNAVVHYDFGSRDSLIREIVFLRSEEKRRARTTIASSKRRCPPTGR